MREENEILAILNEYDWREAMEYCDWITSDVAEIIAMDEGENEGANWIMVVRLKDGRFGFLSAGCDYTGWDCRAGGNSDTRNTLDDLIRWGMGQDDRARLGLALNTTEQL